MKSEEGSWFAYCKPESIPSFWAYPLCQLQVGNFLCLVSSILETKCVQAVIIKQISKVHLLLSLMSMHPR